MSFSLEVKSGVVTVYEKSSKGVVKVAEFYTSSAVVFAKSFLKSLKKER